MPDSFMVYSVRKSNKKVTEYLFSTISSATWITYIAIFPFVLVAAGEDRVLRAGPYNRARKANPPAADLVTAFHPHPGAHHPELHQYGDRARVPVRHAGDHRPGEATKKHSLGEQ